MLVECNRHIMNVAVVGDAYVIASKHLRKSGLISDASQSNDRLLEIIIDMVDGGESDEFSLAGKAIARFEDAQLVWA